MRVSVNHRYRGGALGAGAIACGYFVAASAASALTRFEGGVACLWIANALLLAVVTTLPMRRWPLPMLACAFASVLATALFGLGPAAAVPLAIINIGEVAISAALLARWAKRDALGSVPQLGMFIAAAGIAGPAAVTFAGAGVAAFVSGTPFWSNAVNWFLAHALGALTFTPIFNMIFVGDLRRWLAGAGWGRLSEASGQLALVAATTVLVFSQSHFPILFLPILPVVLTTFRLGRLGAAASVVIIALIGGSLTARGLGPVYLVDGNTVTHIQFLQFYLAVTLLSAFPVAAHLSRRDEIYEQLRDSEERFRLITENSTDIVMTLRPDGMIRYVSPSISQLGGYVPAALVGTPALALVMHADRGRVMAAHAEALAAPAEMVTVDYRAFTADGSLRWFESNMRSIVDENGDIVSVVSAIRDIAHRKSIEHELSKVAATDALTGLANRRAFDADFDRRIAEAADGTSKGGCIALFDIDHFKRINDRYGHDGGDRVLEAFGRIARLMVRDGDMVARLGGEEFAVILSGVTVHQASEICERMRHAIGDARMDVRGAIARITVSAGVAAFDGQSRRREVLRAADDALYAAKGGGRDRLVLAA